ncbi:hypothetical protein FNV43_RR24082 [Rhamnella rubrinervis]|uniref:Uncharacterized protein n=1 Tax=Rhamnella rubrinervis TaxID=2594499 RepID=A0A8K0DL27_9ROSA|nr:hypothetical protein FNV43_RR24082 [Rhamnella rubrinervis]
MDYQSAFKIRALVQQLRPHVLEVLRAPDFHNCKAADKIRKKIKLMKGLYKKTTTETKKQSKVVSENQHSSHKHRPERKRKQEELTLSSDKKRMCIDAGIQGSYIVGGSVLGLNFITFRGSNPVYYGLTKESYRSSHKNERQYPLPYIDRHKKRVRRRSS